MVTVTTANLFAAATSLPYLQQLGALQNTDNQTVNFVEYHTNFTTEILGPNPTAQLLVTEERWQPFHEAGVFWPPLNASLISSNFQSLDNPINTTLFNWTDGTISSRRFAGLAAPNGGTLFIAPNTSSPETNGLLPGKHYYLVADEGTLTEPSALVAVDPVTNTSQPLVTSFGGANFSSLNDVKQHPRTGDLFFTDAAYGYFQAFRGPPVVPQQVYRYDVRSGAVQAIADGFVQPNGIELAPDARTLYVTDSGAAEFTANRTRPASVYSYALSEDGTEVGPRRLFAYLAAGIPDGIHADVNGNVFVAANGAPGINVYSPAGTLLGQMLVQNSVANFEFVKGGLLVFNENRLFFVGIKAVGREVDREFGWK